MIFVFLKSKILIFHIVFVSNAALTVLNLLCDRVFVWIKSISTQITIKSWYACGNGLIDLFLFPIETKTRWMVELRHFLDSI